MSMSAVTIVGNLGRDAELRYTPAGKAVLTGSVAVDDGWGEKKVTNWWKFELWGDRAEKLSQYLTKGAKVAITGRLAMEKWEKDGEKHERVKIVVGELSLEGGKAREAAEPAAVVEDDEEIVIPVA